MSLRRVIPLIIIFLLLCGCAAGGDASPQVTRGEAPSPSSTAGAGEAESPAPKQSAVLPPVPSPAVTEAANPLTPTPAPTTGQTPTPSAVARETPITEEEVRALYKSEGMPVESITPYKGDFLVQYSDGPWWYDWVYGKTGERHRILICRKE